LSHLEGQEVTVQLSGDQRAEAGQTLIFHASGASFGDSVVIQANNVESATATRVASLSLHPTDPVQSLERREALSQAAAADLIVSGRVSAVRLPAAEAQARSVVSGGRTKERISEHAPVWQEAVIDIDSVHKGQHSQKQVVVRYPSSTDVRWHNAPKFHAGQEGVFMLHRQQLARERAAAGVGPEEYTAANAADVQPLEELPQIELAVRGGQR